MLDEDYADFTICVLTKLIEFEYCYLGMLFVNVHYEMFKGTDGENFPGASFSFIHDFYMHIVALKLILNNMTHGSEYNAKSLEDILKANYHLNFPNNATTVINNTMNDATKVFKYFSKDSEQVNCEMHHLNSAMKYILGLPENTISTIAVYDNGLWVNLII